MWLGVLTLIFLVKGGAACTDDVPAEDCVLSEPVTSSCSVTCGGGYSEVRRSIVKYPVGLGKPCPPPSDLFQRVPCNRQDCQEAPLVFDFTQHRVRKTAAQVEIVDCKIEYGPYSECSASCGGGYRTAKGHVVKYPQNGGQPCPHELTQTVPCNEKPCVQLLPIDCQVQYSDYSECSVSCGGGVQTARGYIVQHPQNGGEPCPYDLTVSAPCNEQACPQLLPIDCQIEYGSFSDCSASCGGGYQIAKGQVVRYPQNGGKPCPYDLTQTKACNQQPCQLLLPIDCQVEYGEYSDCSVTCGGGQQTAQGYVVRHPENGGQPCPYDLTHSRACNQRACPVLLPIDCELEYLPPSPCSATCGEGYQTLRAVVKRYPQNGGTPCPNQLEERQPCNLGECRRPVDCQVEYSPYSECSASCGGGFEVSQGRITQYPQYGGLPCPTELIQRRPCAQNPCLFPIDCEIQRLPDTACSASCGSGFIVRRSIIKRYAEAGGQPCPNANDLIETVPCQVRECPRIVDCEVEYGPFAECSASCGGGVQVAQGRVVRYPQNGGRLCPYELTLSRACAENPCLRLPIDCELEYRDTPCSASCGLGFVLRRAVIKRQAEAGGRPCPSDLVESIPCQLRECPRPIDCQVEYSPYSPCSASCGGGIQVSNGFIVQYPANGGAPCPDELTRRKTCALNPCVVRIPIDCEIKYIPNSPCSATCGPGFIERRAVIKRQAENGGRPCPSESELVERIPCRLAECPVAVDCHVEYGPYSACSASCGGGVQVSKGTVVRYPSNGGVPCPYQLTKSRVCAQNPCLRAPIDCEVNYLPYSPCSSTCGPGIQTRSLVIARHAEAGGLPCPSQLTETKQCNLGECAVPVDCRVEYGPFSACSASCGGGTQVSRGRVIQYPAHGGRPCPYDLTESRTCATQPCQRIPIDCEIEYEPFSPCSATCGPGVKTRRAVIVRHPESGGLPCPVGDQLTETVSCQVRDCPVPVDCKIEYGSYSECSASCGGGLQTAKGVIVQFPSNGGAPCPYQRTLTRSCAQHACVEDFEPVPRTYPATQEQQVNECELATGGHEVPTTATFFDRLLAQLRPRQLVGTGTPCSRAANGQSPPSYPSNFGVVQAPSTSQDGLVGGFSTLLSSSIRGLFGVSTIGHQPGVVPNNGYSTGQHQAAREEPVFTSHKIVNAENEVLYPVGNN